MSLDERFRDRQEQNYRDFVLLVEEVNRVMANSLNFAYLPGDNADHGKLDEYELVRLALDHLTLPWFAIVGDYDVHPNNHGRFARFMMPESFYRFEVGSYRFLALDAFASNHPKVFDISQEQLESLVTAKTHSERGRSMGFWAHSWGRTKTGENGR